MFNILDSINIFGWSYYLDLGLGLLNNFVITGLQNSNLALYNYKFHCQGVHPVA